MATERLSFTLQELQDAFPTNAKIRSPRPIQGGAMEALVEGNYLQELPTGTGKTALEYMILDAALRKIEEGETAFWIFPTKALVEQAKKEHPEVIVVFGQNEHVCLWAAESFEEKPATWVTSDLLPVLYQDSKAPRVSDIPGTLCQSCPHNVDQRNGMTNQPSVLPCQYFQQTYLAKQGGGIIAATMSFYIFAKLFSKRNPETVHDTAYGRVAVLVIDEVHRLPDVIRYTLSYDVTDWYLKRAAILLKRIKAPEAKQVGRFLRLLQRIATDHTRETGKEHLLTDDEIRRVINILGEINPKILDPERVRQAVKAGLLDRKRDWREIKTIERLAKDIPRYIHSLDFALAKEEGEVGGPRRPLNYSCSYCREELGENERVQHKLVIHCHYVAPLIRRRLKVPTTVSFSATVGRPDLFRNESGIADPFYSAPSTFPIENRRIYLPSDVEDLSRRADPSSRKKARTLRSIAKGCRQLAKEGIRNLVIVSSNDEREKFMRVAQEEGLDALTYSQELPAKDAALVFKDGNQDVLCGCQSHYGTGVDFPKGTAGAIWILRPGYPDPRSAATQFEIQSFGERRYWQRVGYHVMLEALQGMGRNIRGPRDKGVCFLMSSQFQDFVYSGLPEWLKPAYRRDMTLEECLDDAMELLADLSPASS